MRVCACAGPSAPRLTPLRAPLLIADCFSGYAPLSVRLVQLALGKAPFDASYSRSGPPRWGSMDDALPGGPSAEAEQETSAKPETARAGKKIAMVLFLGGVTHAEIAALRFLGQKDEDTE